MSESLRKSVLPMSHGSRQDPMQLDCAGFLSETRQDPLTGRVRVRWRHDSGLVIDWLPFPGFARGLPRSACLSAHPSPLAAG